MALKNMIGNLFGKALEEGGKIADEFTLSKEEREQFRAKDQERMERLQMALWQVVQARYEQVRAVIAAEMAQGDNFTKRARPSIVYAGLVMYFLKFAGSGFGFMFTIDENFTYVWGGVCGVWIVGRSIEKIKCHNGGSSSSVVGEVSSAITGKNTHSLPLEL